MHDPYVIIRQRLAMAVLVAAAIAAALLLADALTALGRLPYISANMVLVLAVLISAALVFVRFLLGSAAAKHRRMRWLVPLVGSLFFYGLLYRFSVFDLAQLALLLCIVLWFLGRIRYTIAESRGEVLFLVASRLGALLGFFVAQMFWTTIFIMPGVTIIVNFVMTSIVIWQFGRAKNSLVCLAAGSAAFALAGVFTFAVPFANATVAGRLAQLFVVGVTLIGGAIIGLVLGKVSHLAAEPTRQKHQLPQIDASVTLDNRALLSRLQTAGAIRQVPTTTDHAREELDQVRAAPILETALEDKNAAIRGAAAGLIGKLDPTRHMHVEKLLKLAADPNHPDVEGQVRDSLCRLAPHAISQLTNALRGSNQSLREAAAYALREAGPSAAQAIPALRTALGDDAPAVRQKAAGSLARLGATDAETLAALETAARDASLTVRLAAQKAIRELQVAAARSAAAEPGFENE